MTHASFAVVSVVGALLTAAAGCTSSDESLPTASELYGTWVGAVEGTNRVFVFAAADDGSHPELAAMSDVYLLYRYPVDAAPAELQCGHYEIARVSLNEGGAQITDDALVTVIASDVAGTAPGTRYGNGLEGWSGDAFTLRGVSTASGTVTMVRAADGALP